MVVWMWEVKSSSVGNVYLSKQDTNMPDSMRKPSLLKQFQVFEQNYQVLWKFQVNNWGQRIESAKGKNQETTNIDSFCAIKLEFISNYQDANYIKQKLWSMPHTRLKYWRKAK